MDSQKPKFDLTILVLGVLVLRVLVSVGLFYRIDQVYRLVTENNNLGVSITQDYDRVDNVSADDDPYLGPEKASLFQNTGV
jgi:hypothetical protein